MAPLLLVVGSVNYDLIWSHGRLPVAGETVIGADLFESPGGKGANQAVAAARCSQGRFELRVAFAGAIGDDAFGRIQRDTLESDGIDTGDLITIGGAHTGTSSVWVDTGSGENRILSAPGANALYGPEYVGSLPVEDAALILVPNEIPAATIAEVARRAHAAEVPMIWNPAPFPVGGSRAVAPGLARFVTPNEVEASALAGQDELSLDADSETVWATVEALQQRGESGVVMTLGARGVVAAQGDQRWSVAAPQVEAVDTTGAGDAFNGALAASLAGGVQFEEALRLAVAYASESVCHPGTQTSYPRGVEPLS